MSNLTPELEIMFGDIKDLLQEASKYRREVSPLYVRDKVADLQTVVEEAIEKAGLRDKVKIIIGGAPVTEEWARSIGADAWATDAAEGIRKIKNLVQR